MDVIISIGTFICQNIEFSKPNEWLLVIKNGKLVKSGVGIYGFKGFNSSIVKYPSQMQTVDFCADNVTIEMQGVKVSGFVAWQVRRGEEEPLKYYKYVIGYNSK